MQLNSILPCTSWGGYRAGRFSGRPYSSRCIRRLLFMLPLLLASVGERVGLAQSAPSTSLTISQIREDVNDDGIPDRVGDRVTLDGQVIPPHLYIWLIPLGLLLLGFGVFLVLRLKRKGKSQIAQKYKSVFETVPAAVVVTDPEFRIQEANAATLRLFDASQKHLRNKHLFGIVESVNGLDRDAIAHRLESRGSMAIEARYTGKDHAVLDLEVLLRSTKIGNQPRIISCIQDVTKGRKRLGLYEAFLQQLMDAFPIEVIVYSSDGKYRFVNPAVASDEQMREWLIGKSDFEYCEQFGFHMEVALRRRTYRKQAVEEKKTVCYEESITAQTGETRHFLRMFSPQVNEKGKVTVIAGFGLETTELKNALEDGAEARRQAEKMMRIKEAFLQNVSHEFRTPLTGIVGFAQILRDEVPEPVREFAENIESNGQRLMTTLNSMLDMAGLQGENVDLDPAVVNIVREVEIAVRGLESAAREKQLFLRMQPASPEILVCLDRHSLHRILQSLVGNAIKFTESGGVVVEVSEVDEHAVIRVVDSGVGIEQQFMPEIFEAFNQEESGANRSFEGVGLGLTVTKNLVRLLGGSVTVQSEKGEGSMFTIRFPLALSRKTGVFKNRASVLVVDQNAETRRIARHVLDHHFDVREASSVSEGMDLIGRRTFDTVLLDVNMENDLEGTLPERIRQQPGYGGVSIIAMQTDAAPGGQNKYKNLGFDDYLAKPFDKMALLNAIADKSAMSMSLEGGER
jgi:PAS domain S-box-containing protein